MTIQIQCKRCTVPTEHGDICPFCATYTPPATTSQRLDVAVNRVDLIRFDLNTELRQLSSSAPLFAVTDLVIALNHLRQAAVALDKASDVLEADAAVVKP
jgi:hypothetical protein